MRLIKLGTNERSWLDWELNLNLLEKGDWIGLLIDEKY